MTAAKPDHDSLYHRFFSDPAIVAQLLREFVEGPLLDGLDLDGMERLNAKFHADSGQRRDGDLVWRIPRRDGGNAYVMLLLEFQSKLDPWMALRMLVYAGLLWQHLIREKELLPDGKLPPILPIVLFNGKHRWSASVALRDLVGLPEESSLWRWQPDMRFYLIDEGAFSSADLEARAGLPALLFRLETRSDPQQLVGLADAILAWFARHPGFEAARTVIAQMLGAVMAPFGPDIRVPEELSEVRNMLATLAEEWKQQWKQEGLQEGLQEGMQEGLREGEQRGEQRGRRLGEAALLLRLLERRFGALPDWARDRVLVADTVMIEEWGLRVLDAASLEAVLG
jgi:hypothetical protein